MKKQIFYHIAASVLFLFIGKQSASAQSLEYVTTFEVPFEFQVNEKLLPAGKYIVKRDQQRPQILLLNCPERKLWVTFQTITHSLSEQPSHSSMVFKMYGEKHFLAEVKVLGRDEGYALIRSKTERQLAHAAKTKTVRPTQAIRASDTTSY